MENQVKNHPEEETPKPPEEKSGSNEKVSLREVDRYIRYLVFVVLIGLVYVWNAHLAEKQLRKEALLKKEIAEARADFKTMQAKLSSGTRKSVLAEKADSTLGLKILRTPPYKLRKESE